MNDTNAGLAGQVGHVTVPAAARGEVMLPVRGGTEAFAAWADEPVAKHVRKRSRSASSA